MNVLAERLDAKLREWKPNTSALVGQQVTEIINFADHDILQTFR